MYLRAKINLSSQERKWSLNLLERIKCKKQYFKIFHFFQLELTHSILCDDSVIAHKTYWQIEISFLNRMVSTGPYI